MNETIDLNRYARLDLKLVLGHTAMEWKRRKDKLEKARRTRRRKTDEEIHSSVLYVRQTKDKCSAIWQYGKAKQK
jgi:hypothetical protein